MGMLQPKRKDQIAQILDLCCSLSATKIGRSKLVLVVGIPNVGKSTLFNKMIDKDRAIVTNIKGTTRDILSNEFIFNSNKFEVFDTAGQRSKQGKIEKLSLIHI